jgi:hypothetical protein
VLCRVSAVLSSLRAGAKMVTAIWSRLMRERLMQLKPNCDQRKRLFARKRGKGNGSCRRCGCHHELFIGQEPHRSHFVFERARRLQETQKAAKKNLPDFKQKSMCARPRIMRRRARARTS